MSNDPDNYDWMKNTPDNLLKTLEESAEICILHALESTTEHITRAKKMLIQLKANYEEQLRRKDAQSAQRKAATEWKAFNPN